MDITRKYFRQWKQESILAPKAYDYKNPSLNSDEVVLQELANKFDGNSYETYDGSEFEQTALYDGSKVIVTMSRISDRYPMFREFIIESDDVWINLILDNKILTQVDKSYHINAIFGNFDRIMRCMYWGPKSNKSASASEGLNNYDDHLNYISSEDGKDIPVFTYIYKFNNLIFEFEYDPSYAYCSDPFTLRIYEENNEQYTPKKCLGSWSRNSWDELLEFIEPYSKEESKSIIEVVDKSFNDPKIQFDLDQYEKADAERHGSEESDEDEDDMDESAKCEGKFQDETWAEFTMDKSLSPAEQKVVELLPLLVDPAAIDALEPYFPGIVRAFRSRQ